MTKKINMTIIIMNNDYHCLYFRNNQKKDNYK